MNDNELIAWQVVSSDGDVEYTCLKQSTAEYLRDWCMAKEINSLKDAYDRHPLKLITRAIERVSYYIQETEVIVG